MSKTVGVILTIAAVALAIAVPVLTPGVVAGFLGVSTAALTAISVGLSAAIMINSMLMPKGVSGADLRGRQASATTLQLGETPRSALFGTAAVAGTLSE